MDVFAGARTKEALEALAKISNVTPLKLDVTNIEEIKQAKKIIEEKTAGLFGLINNAGIGKGGPLMDVSVEDLRAQFEVNLFGVHQITQAMFPLLLKAKGREIAPYGVKVIIVEPGRVTTPIWDKGEKYLDKYAGSLFAMEAKAIGEYAILKGKTAGLDPLKVAKKVYQILTVANPKLRYIVAKNKLEYQMMKILPASYVDKIALQKVQQVIKQVHAAKDYSK